MEYDGYDQRWLEPLLELDRDITNLALWIEDAQDDAQISDMTQYAILGQAHLYGVH